MVEFLWLCSQPANQDKVCSACAESGAWTSECGAGLQTATGTATGGHRGPEVRYPHWKLTLRSWIPNHRQRSVSFRFILVRRAVRGEHSGCLPHSFLDRIRNRSQVHHESKAGVEFLEEWAAGFFLMRIETGVISTSSSPLINSRAFSSPISR